ncbi:AbrB/MazE/SpoVT family DNA-binding domain-containing protein [Agrobacterium sp. rho-13.3]|jgi:putative addiction module antidote|uniref:AbrB/MazE/SpoVT family DNA-binding domain-containing protein n=1 Tax=Agrobacterium sp. rho-13.3 TaxID=3072980 RepID=UPI002A101299|nr:AbrB/MazE/SpoVT family DNA-binding domain-containing protein [Agrobacterium sp. rho-13.3]MDX8308998.1 AbrB/MazE/SpoVT family DNA-binding domain-containing protein [Agrobacterium sp. rho-13.3]
MKVTVEKIGNSEGITIPAELMSRLGWKVGDVLELRADDKFIELTSARDELEATDDLDRQLIAARKAMRKYRVALSKLANS